jgi:arylformamidase
MIKPTLVDLAIPIEHGKGRLGMPAAFTTPFTVGQYGWGGSTFCLFCHHGTHVDAPNHFIEDGDAIHEIPLTSLVGPAAVVELGDHETRAITGNTLEDRGRHVRKGDIIILRTMWSDKHWDTDTFWNSGPYLSPDGADWIVERGAKAVVYDFSEEAKIREKGWRGEDCIIHHKILGNDIYNIEYVRNLGKIERPRCAIIALPLPLVGLDGSPTRVIALEGVDLPAEFSIR